MEYIIESLLPLAVDIDSVREDPQNARKHSPRNLAAIKKSLKAYGQRKPIVVNSETSIIEAGNGLWRAAKSLGWQRIATVKVKDTPEDAKGFARNVAVIQAASRDSWQAAAWWLERKHPQEWGKNGRSNGAVNGEEPAELSSNLREKLITKLEDIARRGNNNVKQ